MQEWFTWRRIMATSLLRGSCYGAGNGFAALAFAGLAFWWIENNL